MSCEVPVKCTEENTTLDAWWRQNNVTKLPSPKFSFQSHSIVSYNVALEIDSCDLPLIYIQLQDCSTFYILLVVSISTLISSFPSKFCALFASSYMPCAALKNNLLLLRGPKRKKLHLWFRVMILILKRPLNIEPTCLKKNVADFSLSRIWRECWTEGENEMWNELSPVPWQAELCLGGKPFREEQHGRVDVLSPPAIAAKWLECQRFAAFKNKRLLVGGPLAIFDLLPNL